MSTKTHQDMIAAIAAHFADEGVEIHEIHAVSIDLLAGLTIHGERHHDHPAHYRAAVSPLHARALHGTRRTHNGTSEGPVIATH